MNLCKRPGITTRVFLAALATAVLVAVVMGVATHLSFTRGFLGFLNAQQVLRMDAALPSLEQAYASQGSWEFVRNRPDVWFRLLGAEHTLARPGATPTDSQSNLVAPDLLGAGRRLTLLDAQRQRVIGFPYILAASVQREIIVDGNTVGWLAIAPIETATDVAAVKFLQAQWHSLWLAAGLAVLLSGLMAWWVARALLSPVRQVAAATHQLAAGRFGTEVVVQGHDEVAQLAQDFNRLSHALARHEKMRRDFMADVSHELRTPLSVLRGELEAVEDGVHPLTPELLRVMQSQVTALSQLVADLHELALADAGALAYRMFDTDLVSLVRQTVQAFQGRCTERGLTLQLLLPPQPVMVTGDEARLSQLLRNLLDNSVRYTDGPGQVQVSVSVLPSSVSPLVTLAVQDSAPGVDAAALPRLFDRFYRTDSSRSRAAGGSGLGMAIVQSIAQAHGGHVQACNSSLGGLYVEVHLPLSMALTSGAPT
ncbi:HAMP domain-containing protein (plasmid) [Acidovorax sp. DW039]|uniref:ATP-binding protein n=1 Tax=Acidovorax sp. DW039 TaxID=3095606 RepID=UPI00308D4482|nr:HAMP domain-containing protein [Acidovorax sp. DW039]